MLTSYLMFELATNDMANENFARDVRITTFHLLQIKDSMDSSCSIQTPLILDL